MVLRDCGGKPGRRSITRPLMDVSTEVSTPEASCHTAIAPDTGWSPAGTLDSWHASDVGDKHKMALARLLQLRVLEVVAATARTDQPAFVLHRSLQTHLRDAVAGG